MKSNCKTHKETIADIVDEVNNQRITKLTTEVFSNYKISMQDIQNINQIMICSKDQSDALISIFSLGISRGINYGK